MEEDKIKEEEIVAIAAFLLGKNITISLPSQEKLLDIETED